MPLNRHWLLIRPEMVRTDIPGIAAGILVSASPRSINRHAKTTSWRFQGKSLRRHNWFSAVWKCVTRRAYSASVASTVLARSLPLPYRWRNRNMGKLQVMFTRMSTIIAGVKDDIIVKNNRHRAKTWRITVIRRNGFWLWGDDEQGRHQAILSWGINDGPLLNLVKGVDLDISLTRPGNLTARRLPMLIRRTMSQALLILVAVQSPACR